MKQTAVEWLVEQYEKAFILKVNNVMTSIIEQAKEMEKQQIIDAAADHCYPTCELARVDAEQYYTSTYESKGSDNLPKVENKDSFGEISDEEINEFVSKKYAHHKFLGDYRLGINKGMKLYKELLKTKQ